MKRILVLGMGNWIRGDDSAGISVAKALSEQTMYPDIEIRETQESGINLMDIIAGYKRVIFIDSLHTGKEGEGNIYRFTLFKNELNYLWRYENDYKYRQILKEDEDRDSAIGFVRNTPEKIKIPYSLHHMGFVPVIKIADTLTEIPVTREMAVYAIGTQKDNVFSKKISFKIKKAVSKTVDLIKHEFVLTKKYL